MDLILFCRLAKLYWEDLCEDPLKLVRRSSYSWIEYWSRGMRNRPFAHSLSSLIVLRFRFMSTDSAIAVIVSI